MLGTQVEETISRSKNSFVLKLCDRSQATVETRAMMILFSAHLLTSPFGSWVKQQPRRKTLS